MHSKQTTKSNFKKAYDVTKLVFHRYLCITDKMHLVSDFGQANNPSPGVNGEQRKKKYFSGTH